MKDDEVKKMVKLRDHVIKFYSKLEEINSPTSVMNTRDSALLCEEVIKSIDDLIKEYVTFTNN